MESAVIWGKFSVTTTLRGKQQGIFSYYLSSKSEKQCCVASSKKNFPESQVVTVSEEHIS